MLDPKEMTKGGFAESAALNRQRQAAREVEAWDAALAASRAETPAEPPADPQDPDADAPPSQPQPAEKTNVRPPNGTRPPLRLDTTE